MIRRATNLETLEFCWRLADNFTASLSSETMWIRASFFDFENFSNTS
jgi:hypothetical protein